MIFSRYLDTNGDGTGTKNANGNYSSAAETFYIDGPLTITRMIVSVEDTGGMQAEEYGNLGTALTNGITIDIDSGGLDNELVDLTDGEPIKTNAGWGQLCYDVDLKSWGAGDDLLVVRWTFDKSGAPIKLGDDDRLEITLNDDFSGLIGHYFLVQGQE